MKQLLFKVKIFFKTAPVFDFPYNIILTVFLLLPIWHRWQLLGTNEYFPKVQNPFLGNQGVMNEDILHTLMAYIFHAKHEYEHFFLFGLIWTYFVFIIIGFLIYKNFVIYGLQTKKWHYICLLACLLASTITRSVNLSLSSPDVWVVFAVSLVLLSSHKSGLVIGTIFGVFSHNTLFVFSFFSVLLLKHYASKLEILEIPYKQTYLTWKHLTISVYAYIVGFLLLRVWFFVFAVKNQSQNRLEYIFEYGGFQTWVDHNVKTIGDYYLLHGAMWPFAILLIYFAYRLSKQLCGVYLLSIFLGLITTFFSLDRPRIFISIAWAAFFYITLLTMMLMIKSEYFTRREKWIFYAMLFLSIFARFSGGLYYESIKFII